MTTPKATLAEKAQLLGRAARVAASVVTERISPQQAVHEDDVPLSAVQITPQWLTAVLCKGVPGAEVLDIKLTGGDSGSSTRRGLELVLNAEAHQAGLPTRLFTKSSPTFVQRMHIGFSGAVIGETGFYMQVRPQLDIEAPRGYHGCMDATSWRSMILMEDIVATKDAKFISSETYFDRQKIESLLANMAKWHGHFWASPQLAGELSWLRTPAQFLEQLTKFISMKGRSMMAMEKYAEFLPADIRHLGDKLWEAASASVQISSRDPQTFLHGDCHVGQTYLTRDGNVGYSDWQYVMRGSWAYDFAYSLVSALTIEDRRNWDRDLLRYYLDRLHASGGPKLDFDAAWLAYRQQPLYPYVGWAYTWAGAGTMQPNFQPEYVCKDVTTRLAHAVSDLDSINAVKQV